MSESFSVIVVLPAMVFGGCPYEYRDVGEAGSSREIGSKASRSREGELTVQEEVPMQVGSMVPLKACVTRDGGRESTWGLHHAWADWMRDLGSGARALTCAVWR